MNETSNIRTNATEVGLLRRLGAMVYDLLLLCAVLFIATAALLPFTGGHAIARGNSLYSSYLLLIWFVFYGWFWTHGGQTLGMRAWKMRLLQSDGRAVTWQAAGVRFLLAGIWLLPVIYLRQIVGLRWWICLAVGLCFLGITLVLRLHDRYSDTVLVRYNHKKNP
ncbi:MAG: RDD family protein [Gammaproteobacteria bacterium]|nr:RDD family protein [Gammaproteobacteria bacterium]MCP5425538.1 RDD family protein [Gammaproteobacteria bacterium]MCP5459342.1 RDD family protein [Gammaproteobacteria bacterium]